jgi:hypothetical protein
MFFLIEKNCRGDPHSEDFSINFKRRVQDVVDVGALFYRTWSN